MADELFGRDEQPSVEPRPVRHARETYVGSNGYSLRLDGLEPGFNGHALERAIVMHGAPYVDDVLAKQQGRIGRSWGCPALRPGIARSVIDTSKGGAADLRLLPRHPMAASLAVPELRRHPAS